jgi:hypothetical protein
VLVAQRPDAGRASADLLVVEERLCIDRISHRRGSTRQNAGEFMRAPKLIQHLKDDADRMSERLLEKIRNSRRCSELLLRVPAEEHKKYAGDVYHDLLMWLVEENESLLEHYVGLGKLRAQQGVPFSDLFWAVCITREYLWEYIQQECLIEEPVEFWGGVMLLRSLNQFFDRALYLALLGYEMASAEVTGSQAVFQ